MCKAGGGGGLPWRSADSMQALPPSATCAGAPRSRHCTHLCSMGGPTISGTLALACRQRDRSCAQLKSDRISARSVSRLLATTCSGVHYDGNRVSTDAARQPPMHWTCQRGSCAAAKHAHTRGELAQAMQGPPMGHLEGQLRVDGSVPVQGDGLQWAGSKQPAGSAHHAVTRSQ